MCALQFPRHFDAPQRRSACEACSALHQVADTFTLTPPKIASHFGITAGHIHHIDNSFGFDERFPCATPVPGLYSASAGARGAVCCHGCLTKSSAVCLCMRLSLTCCPRSAHASASYLN